MHWIAPTPPPSLPESWRNSSLSTNISSCGRNIHSLFPTCLGIYVSYTYTLEPADCHFESTMCDYENVADVLWELGSGLSTVPDTGVSEER